LVANCHRFLVPDVQPLHAAMAAQGIGEAIEAVAHDSIDALDPGRGEGFDHLVCNSACHVQGEGGTWTPGALMGPALRKRLKERAGLTFSAR
jgi:hypothetical protein